MPDIPDLRRAQPFATENASKGASHLPSIRANFGEPRTSEVRHEDFPRRGVR
jgi:hypothetical protein